ncbi:hypothetical protein RHGRI_013749 [Rhododendron griersonianum]|uniref:F-box domain-containing protein n=1 Tax=Rhododendron griersonianum TaxID=479676 RepID=A0AAV6K6P5_9ERIC|nr:hypothetical protein RHGRI_013749 [Rhododendron griersonianum]
MSDFPMDVVTEILLRLPVRALLRFRCVSKSWRNLIHSWDFVESHLKRSIETKTHLSLILTHFSTYSVDFDSLDNAVELDHMLKSKPLGTQVLGSCNGLICLSHGLDDIAIWNPSTRKCRQLPRAKIDYFEFGHVSYGFGSDAITDDYKVVKIFESKVQVCSMRLSSWKRIQDFPYYMRYGRGYGVLVGSALHWVVTREPDLDNTANLIGAFDLSVEEFWLVPLPDYSDKTFHVNLGVLDGCLCLTATSYGARSDVWVMKDYGVEESWSKLLSVGQEVNRSFGFVIPIAYSKNGCEILMAQDNKKFIWYDLEHNTVKNIKICGLPDSFETVMGVESLIRLKGGDGLNRDGKGKNRRKNQKKNLKKRLMSPESSTFAQEMKMQSFENQMGRVPEDADDGLRIIW